VGRGAGPGRGIAGRERFFSRLIYLVFGFLGLLGLLKISRLVVIHT